MNFSLSESLLPLLFISAFFFSIRLALSIVYGPPRKKNHIIVLYLLTVLALLIELFAWFSASNGQETLQIIATAFDQAVQTYGSFEALLTLVVIFTIGLWLFWIPAELYVSYKSPAKIQRWLIRGLNIFFGTILFVI